MRVLKAAAIDIDGVLVADTFSPVIRSLVEARGHDYDRDIERHVFSQNRLEAARYLLNRLNWDLSEQELLDHYFQVRAQWIERHGGGPLPGIDGFLGVLEEAGLRLVCYGGLARDHFLKELGPWSHRFETYVCTDSFRPGVAEIVQSLSPLRPEQIVFFDDVSRVGEAARSVGCPFIGVPSSKPWSFQRADMKALGVPLLLEEIGQLTPEVLKNCDLRAAQGYWRDQ